jgi:hypothetical protein
MSLLSVFLFGFTEGDIIPKGWHKAGSNKEDFRIGLDDKVSHHGQKSAFVESIAKEPSGFCTLMQTFTNKDYSDKRVKMTCFVKTEGTIDTAQMWVRIDDYDKKVFGDFDNMDNRPITGTNDWMKCEIIFDVPVSNCSINFGIILYGTGKTWIDNVSFEIVDKLTEKTAFTRDRSLPSSFIKENLTNSLNLDFEE